MAHDITDNRNEKLVDHVESILVFPLSLILSLMGHLDSRLRGNGIRKGAQQCYIANLTPSFSFCTL